MMSHGALLVPASHRAVAYSGYHCESGGHIRCVCGRPTAGLVAAQPCAVLGPQIYRSKELHARRGQGWLVQSLPYQGARTYGTGNRAFNSHAHLGG
jgi:hypothetical protein